MATLIREMDEAFLFSPEVQGILEKTNVWEFNTMTEAEKAGLTRGTNYNTYTVKVTYLEKDYWLPLIVDVDIIGENVQISPRGVRTVTNLGDVSQTLGYAFGMNLDNIAKDEFIELLENNEYTKMFISAATDVVDQLFIDCYITKDGTRNFFDRFMTNAYAVLYDTFGPDSGTNIDCKYSYKKANLVEGQSILNAGDDTNVSNIVGTILYNSPLTGLNYETGVDDLLGIVSDNPAVEAILKKPAVRIAKRTGELYIWGYDVLNNDVVTTNEASNNQHYSITITHYYSASFVVQDGHLVLESTWNSAVSNHSETFYNYTRTVSGGVPVGVRITNGFISTTEAKAGFDTVSENIGIASKTKDFTPIGRLPSAQPMADNYPNWPKDGDDWPVGDPDGEPEQEPIWTGDINPVNPIIVPRIPGFPIEKIEDIDSESTKPDVDGVQATYGLFTVYKCTFGELLQLANFLWQENTITALKNIWANDPMSSIISLHQIYKTPSTTGTKEIVLGYVPSGVSALRVEDRYQKVDCGSVVLGEYFDDVRDYQTELTIYLPFIGMRQIDISECLGGRIAVEYYVDIFTGDCLATIGVQRGATHTKVLYTFNGNCASPLPLTGADKSRLFANIANVAVGTVSGLVRGAMSGGVPGAVGGAVGSLLGGAGSLAMNHNIDIQKSGSVSGNFGAMGYKKPYLIIGRPQPYNAVDREQLEGLPANITVNLGRVSGYTRVKYVHVDNIPGATDTEKQAIETLLKEGVIL